MPVKLDYLMPIKCRIFRRDLFIFSGVSLCFCFFFFLLDPVHRLSLPVCPSPLWARGRHGPLEGSTAAHCPGKSRGFLFSWQVRGALVRTKRIITEHRNPQRQSIVVNSNTRSGKILRVPGTGL